MLGCPPFEADNGVIYASAVACDRLLKHYISDAEAYAPMSQSLPRDASEQRIGADPPSSRSRSVCGGLSSRRDCAEKESTVTPRPWRSTRSLVIGKIIAVAAGQEVMAL